MRNNDVYSEKGGKTEFRNEPIWPVVSVYVY